MTLLQQRIDTLETTNSGLQLELTSAREELERAHGDVKRYSDDAAQKQELYQHELIEHSKSVQALLDVKEKVHVICWVLLMLSRGRTTELLI